MPDVARWQAEHADELTIALLSDGDPELVRAEAAQHGLENVLIDETLSAYEAYAANGTPSAVLVADDGTIASWLAAGADWIEMLVQQWIDPGDHAAGLPVGSELPPLRLVTLDGGEAVLGEVVAGPTVILFWNPGCGFCRAMHDQVTAWEQQPSAGAPRLMVVSAGSADEVSTEAFASTVLLDPDWTASAALGADGTPMAVLVDEDARIASPLVTGADAVLDLLGAGTLSAAR
jgi:thiol-disulfide isomerase/thioredoxin